MGELSMLVDTASQAVHSTPIALDHTMSQGRCWEQFGIPCCLINAPQ